MGFIEEGRQLIQDFVTPEIHSLDARLTAVEKQLESLDRKVDRSQTSMEKRFDSLETKIDKVQAALEAKIDRSHVQLLDALRSMERYNDLAERMARVESKLQHVA